MPLFKHSAETVNEPPAPFNTKHFVCSASCKIGSRRASTVAPVAPGLPQMSFGITENSWRCPATIFDGMPKTVVLLATAWEGTTWMEFWMEKSLKM
jgi:hypothetical protein